MIHLFNRVYLDLDTNMNAYMSRYVISKTMGYPHPDDEPVGFQPIFTTTEVNEYIDTKFEEDLVSLAYSSERIIFYFDENGYAKALSRWLRTLYTELDPDVWVDLMGTFIRRDNSITGERIFKYITNRADLVPYTVDVEPMNDVAKMVYTNWSMVSFEHQIVQYKKDKNPAYIRKTISNLARIFFRDTIYELRRDLKIFLYHPWTMETLGYEPADVEFGKGLFKANTKLQALAHPDYHDRGNVIARMLEDDHLKVKEDLQLLGIGEGVANLFYIAVKDPSELKAKDVDRYLKQLSEAHPLDIPYSGADADRINLSMMYYVNTIPADKLPKAIQCKK